MPELWMDVDIALSEVPVNLMPLLDDTDFKTRETAIAYNQAGMDLVWNFTKTDGTTTQTAVTPTTGGNYDWNHQGDGMYTIEIPASGGASINNDTEGFGWFTGICTGVLPWRGPVIGFRAAGLNNLLIDDAFSTTRGLAGTALPNAAADAAGGLPISDAGGLDLDAILVDTGTTLPSAIGDVSTDIQNLETTLLRYTPYIHTGTVANAATNNIDLGDLTLFGYANDDLNDCLIRFWDDSESRHHSAWITDFVAATSVVTLDAALPFTTENGVDTYTVFAIRRNVKTVEVGGSTTASITAAMFTDTGLTYNGDAETNSVIYEIVEKIRKFLQLVVRKDSAIAIDNATELTALNASGGSGTGTYANTTDSAESIRDRGDAAWTTGTGTSTLTQADVRTAVGLASANLDTQLSGIPAATETLVDGIVQTYRLHELLESALGASPATGSLFGDLTEDDGGTQRFTTNALEQAPSGGGGSSPELLVTTTITGLVSNQLFQLTAGSSDDNAYNGCLVVIEDASSSDQKCVAVALAYSGATKTLSLLNDPGIFTIANGDTISIIADRSLHPDVDNTTLDIDPASGNVGIDWGNIVNKTTTNDLTGTSVLADMTKISGDSTAADKLEAWLDSWHADTAQAGSSTTITLATGASTSSNFYDKALVIITGGTGAGQARIIEDYVGSTRVATVSTWITNPNATSTYVVIPVEFWRKIDIRNSMKLAPGVGSADSGSIDDLLADILALIASSAIGDATWDEVIEGSLTARQMLRAVAAVLAGKVSGGGTTNPIFRNMSDTKNVVSATVDASGNRTAQTYDLT